MTTDYEEYYKGTKNALGAPSKHITKFFAELSSNAARVLDIGCGQGRDALFIARLGHRVTGVDISPTGIADMQAAAAVENLLVTGIVADIVGWRPSGIFDVILFDRTLHMLDPKERVNLLRVCLQALAPDGYVLIDDEVPNLAALQQVLTQSKMNWRDVYTDKSRMFARAVPDDMSTQN